jgi:hypothetical protein
VEKRRRRGPAFFPAGRKAGIFFRSLSGFGTVEFGIAAIFIIAPVLREVYIL